MDLSDGLSSDLPRLCAASGVGARIHAGKIPLVNLLASPRHSRRKAKSALHGEALALALHGGDDYELLFAVPRSKASRVPTFFKGISLLPIGEITASRKILLIDDRRKTTILKPGGWDPFR